MNKTDRISELNQLPNPRAPNLRATKTGITENVKVIENDTSVNATLKSHMKSDMKMEEDEIMVTPQSDTKNSFTSKPKHVICNDNSLDNRHKVDLQIDPLEKTENEKSDSSSSEVAPKQKIPDVAHRNDTFIKQVRSTSEEKHAENDKKGALKSMFSKLFGKK